MRLRRSRNNYWINKFPYGNLKYVGGDNKTAKEFLMKKIVFFIIAMVVFGSCFAQKADAQSANIEQKIIGTWAEQNGDTWVFNTNGTLTMSGEQCKYVVINTKIALYSSQKTFVYDILISSDGKTLILSPYFGLGFWLTKK